MDSNELFSHWKSAEFIYPSAFELCDQNLRNTFKRLHTDLSINLNNSPEFKSTGIGFIGGLAKDFSKTNSLSSEIGRIVDKIKRDILKKLAEDKLIGLGFESNLKTTDTPQIIPPHAWPQNIKNINWENSSFTENGINFLKIKIIPVNKINQSILFKEETDNKNEIKNKTPGRPSMREMLLNIFNNLENEDMLRRENNLSSYTVEIQRRAKEIRPDLKHDSPSYKTICKYLSKHFDVWKNSL
jgi:hypothetical protein